MKDTSTTGEHNGVLMKFASKVNPTKLFSKDKDKNSNKSSNNKNNKNRNNNTNTDRHPRKLSVEFTIPPDDENKDGNSPLDNAHDFHDTNSLNSNNKHHAFRNRSKSTSCLNYSKLEYNPYGIYNHHNLQRLGSAFGNGNEKEECNIMIPNPISYPNDYLPEMYHETIQNLSDKYLLSDKNLGIGGSATIKKIYLKDDKFKTHNYYALKKFSIYSSETQDKYYNRIATEYSITRSLVHLHTIRCYELLQLPVTLQRAWGMVLTYYNYDLYKLIKNSSWKNIPFLEKMCVFKQICFGLKYIHEQDITHLDIKADNVMVSKNGVMKITDYGCSEVGHEEYGNFNSKVSYKSTRLGTPPYQPPEVARYGLLDQDSRQPYCPFRFDYWSLGILLYVIVFGKVPFNSSKDTDHGYQIFKAEYTYHMETNPLFSKDLTTKLPKNGVFSDPNGNDPNFVYLFWRLCDPNPKTRMTLPKLFHNKFFQNLEMCLDERIYECNFHKHEMSKGMKFTVPIDDYTEITQQNEIKHSLWDDIPTISSSNPTNINEEISIAASKSNDIKNVENLSVLNESDGEEEDEEEVSGIEDNQEKKDDSIKNYTTSKRKISPVSTRSSSSNLLNKSRSIDIPSLHSFKIDVPTYRSLCRKSSRNPSTFTYSDGVRQSYFVEDDYNDKENKYMIVNFSDICDACNYTVVPHSHNMMYSYKEKE